MLSRIQCLWQLPMPCVLLDSVLIHCKYTYYLRFYWYLEISSVFFFMNPFYGWVFNILEILKFNNIPAAWGLYQLKHIIIMFQSNKYTSVLGIRSLAHSPCTYMIYMHVCFNAMRPGDAYMNQQTTVKPLTLIRWQGAFEGRACMKTVNIQNFLRIWSRVSM